MNTATKPTIDGKSAASATTSLPATVDQSESSADRTRVGPDAVVVVDGRLTEAGEMLVSELVAEILPLINQAPSPGAALAAFGQLLREGIASIVAGRCTVYRWCVETNYHFDHTGADHTVSSLCRDEPLVYAHLLHLSGSKPIIGLQGEDLDADQARSKAAELRKLADTVDEMAGSITEGRTATTPGHWPWCQPGECVTRQYDDGETYIEHYGRKATAVLVDTDGSDMLQLRANLCYDQSTAKKHPDIFLEDPDGNCVFLDVISLDATIARLSSFTGDLRGMRRQMMQPPCEAPAPQEIAEQDVDRLTVGFSEPQLEVRA
ncbi:hypothetical protein [Streptomyces sp. NPDC101178]|uniref:hypothetical protein n=1 Tax=Streptomyces sp. NPDC101178 TaxID=3366124 RepID=UPI0037FE99EC